MSDPARNYDIAPGVSEALSAFRAPPRLGFGDVVAPVMYTVDWRDGAWQRGSLVPYGPIQVLPGARALQYAELVFEGMKAYRVTRPAATQAAVTRAVANLFRPRDNWQRLARSAARLSMPVVPEALFFEAIDAVVGACLDIIPQDSGRALYLRPFLFGTEAGYLLRNSTTFSFMVIANPVEIYAAGPMRVAIERRDVRAAVGGLGDAKTAANYAASLRGSTAAVTRGMTVALWLDAREQRYIQELSGMNVFAVIDGVLHTPELDGAILPGVTRDSLLTLARHLGYTVIERPMLIDELLGQIASGECSEVFACGTAATVSPIGALADSPGTAMGSGSGSGSGREYQPKQVDAVAARLREALLAIQERRAPDPFGWTRDVPAPAW
jgi:branched-chain amino acid aminotransferase